MIIVLSSLVYSIKPEAKENSPSQDGLYTITHYHKQVPISLDGEWEFYWKKLLTPQDFHQNQPQVPAIIQIPHNANGYQLGNGEISHTGYGTYRLRIKFPKEEMDTIKTIYIPNVATAYTVWIDGEQRASSGVVGVTKELMKPNSIPKVINFMVNSDVVEVLIQSSNFHQRKAGIYDSILLGEPEIIAHYQDKKVIYRTMIVMSLLLMGLYHVALFAFRKQEPSLIFFGMVCLLIGIRATLLEEGLAAYLLSFLNWEIASKIEYLGASLGILFFSLFTFTQFSEDMNRKFSNAIIGTMAIYSLFIVLFPAIVFTQTMVFMQVLIILTFIYLIFVYLKAVFHKREDSLLNALAIFSLFITIINDTLFFNNLINTTEMSSVGLLFFLFTQAIIISKKYSMAFVRNERLSRDLFVLNQSLEHQVQLQTAEIRESNRQLQIVNKKLQEAEISRIRIIGNICHEIGNPLTSMIAYTKGMLDGVIQIEKKYIHLVYEKSLYLSEMLNDLRGMVSREHKEMKYEMQRINIRHYLQTLYEKYKPDLEKQRILFLYDDLLFPNDEEIFVLMDPVRIEQVMVNLLSNAQRFVEENGKIVIELGKEEDYISIKVIDNGIGIKEDELEFVFDRFFRGKKKQLEHNGTGLGLAISKEIVQFHKGKMGVQSKEGFGTTFSFILPISQE
jgi:signal transduction histidine kinase